MFKKKYIYKWGHIVINDNNILNSKMYNEFLFCFNSIKHK